MAVEIGLRKLLTKSKGGAMFTVPQIWLKNSNLSVGDRVNVRIGEQGELIIQKVEH